MKNHKIQILRAIAIIAVVMIHTCPAGIMQVYARPFINFAVATFLFISGYLTNISNINWKQLYKKRITRVIIPYIIWTLIYTTAGFVVNGINLKKYIINLLTTQATGTLYYIFVYIQFVILTPFLSKLIKSKYHWIGWLISPISLIIKYYWVLSGTIPNNYISILWSISCLGWFPCYYLGLLLGNKVIQRQYNLKKLIMLYAFTIIIQIFEGYIWHILGETNCGTQLKLSSLLTSSIFILIANYYINNTKVNKSNKLLVTIGNYSFGIYISHMMVIMVLQKIIPNWSLIPFGLNSIIVLILTTFFVVIGKKICGPKLSKWLGLY